jgi:hypothetical protein
VDDEYFGLGSKVYNINFNGIQILQYKNLFDSKIMSENIILVPFNTYLWVYRNTSQSMGLEKQNGFTSQFMGLVQFHFIFYGFGPAAISYLWVYESIYGFSSIYFLWIWSHRNFIF